MKTHFSKIAIGLLFITFQCGIVLRADQVRIYTTPNTPSSSFVAQVTGFVLTDFYSVSNSFVPPLDRANITNLLQAYLVAQNPTNFDLYASLFESSSRPVNDGEFGAVPDTMWFKGLYQYGNYTLADARFRYTQDNSQKLHDTLLTMIRSNGFYYLTADMEDIAVCLFEKERDQEDASNGTSLLATNWTGNGYFAMTNYAFKTNLSNPWIFWLPGYRLNDALVTSNSPAISNNFTLPENIVIAGVQSLIASNQTVYLGLVYPDDLNQASSHFNMTPADYVRTNWNSSRKVVANGVKLSERVVIGDIAYVTFRPLTTNSIAGDKDWLFLRRFNSEWRLSANYEDNGNTVISYLLDSCAEPQPAGPKVLPGP